MNQGNLGRVKYMSTYDAIVVGGGPAGVSSAYTLAKLGRSVLLLDKKSHDRIGDKSCGDALDRSSPEVLFKEFGLKLPHGDEVSDELKYMTIATPEGHVKMTAPGYTVDRHIYGQRLLKECENAGVEVIGSAPVRDVIIEDGFVKGVKYMHKGEMIEVRSTVVIDCSGTFAAVRKRLPEGFSEGLNREVPDYHIAASYREIVELKEKDHPYKNEIVLLYKENIPPPGYLWFFTKGPKRLNLGTGWLKSESHLYDKSMKQIYREALDDHYKRDEYEVLKTGGGQIPVRPPFDCLTFNGGMVVGDAGCMVDPTTAEGHGPALVTGYFAGKVASESIDRNDVSREGLWAYNVQVMELYGVRNSMSYVALRYLRKLSPDGLQFIIKRGIITENELKDIYDGEENAISLWSMLGKVIKCFPKYGLLWTLKRMVDDVKEIGTYYEQYPSDPSDLKKWREGRNALLKEEL